jgi:nitrate reductase alpha subunit
MKTAVEWLIDELYKQGISLYTPELIEQAKEMEKEQKIEFAKLHVQKALKAVENEMILSASAVKHWYLPETIN